MMLYLMQLENIKNPFCKQVLTPNGIYVSVNGMMAKVSKEDMILLKKTN